MILFSEKLGEITFIQNNPCHIQLRKENQKEYYNVLGVSDCVANSTKFIEFMLSIILNTIEEIIQTEKKVTVKVTLNQKKILEVIKNNPQITQEELANVIGLTRKSINSNMKKLQENGLLKRIGADKNGYWQLTESFN